MDLLIKGKLIIINAGNIFKNYGVKAKNYFLQQIDSFYV